MCQISWDMSQITMKLQDRARKIDSYTDSLTNSDIGINSLTYIQQSTENFRHAQNYSDSRLESQHLIQPARIELHTFNLLTDTGKKQISNNKGFKWRILWYIVPKFDLRREPMSVPILDLSPPHPSGTLPLPHMHVRQLPATSKGLAYGRAKPSLGTFIMKEVTKLSSPTTCVGVFQ